MTATLRTRFSKKNQSLAAAAVEVLREKRPMTARQCFYLLVSRGYLPSTSAKYYDRLLQVLKRLRESGEVPRRWIVDHVRATYKPSSWSGLADFAESVRSSYRRDFWSEQTSYVEVLVEKDAVAGTLQPVTSEFDVALRVLRGYSSISFTGEMADEYSDIQKPTFLYYCGDFDASGHDIERDLVQKLRRYTGSEESELYGYDSLAAMQDLVRSEENPAALESTLGLSDTFGEALDSIDVRPGDAAFLNQSNEQVIYISRLGVREEDFDSLNLLPLQVKSTDSRAPWFREKYGDRCAELDAIDPAILRSRVRRAIECHINSIAWERLQRTEQLEKNTLQDVVAQLEKVGLAPLFEDEEADE